MALRVEVGIPYGNACDVTVEEKGEFVEVAFAADPHGGPECLWFCVRLRQEIPGTSGARVRLVLKHAETMLGVNRPEGIRPVIRHADGDWERLGPGAGERLPDGRLAIRWEMDAPTSYADVAFCYPYGREEVETLLRETDSYWRADVIGVSQGGRPLIRLSNDYGSSGDARAGVYLIARQHSGETPGSWVLDGLLRRLAVRRVRSLIAWAVPLANIDGVEQGDYGKDNFPYDLNRAWGTPPMRHETLVIGGDVHRWKDRCRPMLLLDLHAPGGCETDGIYAFVTPSERAGDDEETQRWCARMKDALAEFASPDFCRRVNYPSRWETPSASSFARAHDICGIVLEIPYAQVGECVLTQESYREAGARLAEALIAAAEG